MGKAHPVRCGGRVGKSNKFSNFFIFVARNRATNPPLACIGETLNAEVKQMMTFSQKCGTLNETSVRERLKAEITTLTDRQAEYVLRRLQDVQDKKAVKG